MLFLVQRLHHAWQRPEQHPRIEPRNGSTQATTHLFLERAQRIAGGVVEPWCEREPHQEGIAQRWIDIGVQ